MEAEVSSDDHVGNKEEPVAVNSPVLVGGQVSSAVENQPHNSDDHHKHGYIDKRTGTHFVNASQQTERQRDMKCKLAQCFTRSTQIYETRNQCWNTSRETSTQMEHPGLILDAIRDYSLNCGPYEDSKAWEEKRDKAATIIQRYARRRHARCKARKLRKYAKEKQELIAELEKKQKAEEELQLKVEIHKHKHPRKKQDFDVLYREVAVWHVEELQSIKGKGLSEIERKLALQELLHKLYTALSKCSRTVDERMCVLGYIKWTVQEFDCQLTKELIQLIEREADLMYRNRPTESLQGLRQRILDLFLKFIQVPKFNPEAATYQCLPKDFDHSSYQTLRQQAIPIYLHS